MRKEGYDFGAVIDLLKNIGVVAGGLGGLAALFFWIGNAIIVARLRAYNLYGLVHYTDEYVKEAGYQFFQDVFTFSFFQQWELILALILVIGLLILLIPVGPFSINAKTAKPPKPAITKNPLSILMLIRSKGIHYLLFLLMALPACIALTSNLGVKNHASGIIYKERLLYNILTAMKKNPPIFVFKGEDAFANEFQKRFFDELTVGKDNNRSWMKEALSAYYNDAIDDDSLFAAIKKFQKDFEINESTELKFEEGLKASQTYRVLQNVYFNKKLSERLYAASESMLRDIKELLSAHLNSDEDYSSMVVMPANYVIVNNSISKAKLLRENILAYFEPENDEAKKIMSDLSVIRPIHFGSKTLFYSFWVLIVLLIYLLVNIQNILKFSHWEKGYYFLMLFLFLTIVISLPTAYGRYKFEFRIQKLTDIVFTGSEANPVTKKMGLLLENKARLYILGPTRGKEVIVGAIKSDKDASIDIPQIIVLDRDTYKYMSVEPVRIEEIPEIIKMLKYRKSH